MARLPAALLAVVVATCARVPSTAPRPVASEPAPPSPAITLDPGEAEAPLTVVAARPSGEADVDVHPTITFSKPIVALGTIERELALGPPATITPPVAGTWTWLGSSSVELVPEAPLHRGTEYRVTVPAGLRALDGSTLAAPTEITFRTPIPELLSISPADRSRWAGPKPTLALTWSAPVADLADHLALTVSVGGVAQPVALTPVGDEGVIAARRARGDQVWPWEADDPSHVYRFVPASPLPLDSDVTITVSAGVRSPEGPLGTATPSVHHLRTYGPLAITEVAPCADPDWQACTSGPAVLTTSNPVDPASLRQHLSVHPPVTIAWDEVSVVSPYASEAPTVELPGDWHAGTTYTIEVSAGVVDVFGQTSSASFAGTIRTHDLAPSMHVPEPVLLEAGGDARMPITLANVRSVEVEVWRVDVPTLARLAAAGDPSSLLPRTNPARVRLPGPPRNVRRAVPLDVRAAIGARTGLFVARFASRDLPKRDDGTTRIDVVRGQITDLAVHAKLGPASGLAWVTSLAAGTPVAGAKVDVVDEHGVVRWSGASDADGLVRVPGMSELMSLPPDEDRWRWQAPFALVAASKGGDVGVTLSTWSGDLDPWAFGLGRTWDGRVPKSLGTAFTDRGIYRPGEVVKLAGITRTRSLGRIASPPAGTHVTVLVTGPDDDAVWKGEASTSAFGTFDASVPLDPHAKLGRYGVLASAVVQGEELSWYADFRVEAYKAPPFRVDVLASAGAVLAGEPLGADVAARYLFGAPMVDAPVRWTALRRPTEVRLKGAVGFAVGDQASWWDASDEAWAHEGVFATNEGRTGASGTLHVDAGAAEAPLGRTWEVTIEAEVENVSRVRAAGRATVMVHPAAVYAGVRLATSGFPRKGVPATIELVAVGVDGERVAGVPIAVEVTRRTWASIRELDPGGGDHVASTPKDEVVATCAVTSAATPVSCAFTPAEAGVYRIAATATDAAGRHQVSRDVVWVAGDGWVAWDRGDADRVDLVADKDIYDVGDVARVLVQSPWPQAEAIVTVEREGVLSSRRVKLDGSATALEIPIDEAYVPNVFVGVVLVRGRVGDAQGTEPGIDPGRPAFRVGYVELPVERASKRLDVSVTPLATEARPGDAVPIDLVVRDHEGRPVQAQLVVWAVDEAVLRLTSYERPDLVDALHPPQGLSTFLAEPLLMLTRFVEQVGKGDAGGGGGGDPFASGVRKDFRTTPLWAPSVVTDASGRARVVLSLPDDLTTFRVMAVAIDAGDRAGGAQSAIEVEKPLLALPSLPRLLRVGDQAEIGVVVHAPSLRPRKVVVSARTGSLALRGPASRTVSLADGAPVEVRFPVEAVTPGATKLQFAVTAGDEHDALELPFEVQLPVEVEAIATYGTTASQVAEAIVPPQGVRTDVGGLQVTLASTVLGGLGEGMGQLLDYPYGCVEQRASRLVPLIALRELQQRFGVAVRAEDVLRAAAGVDALRAAGSADPDAVVRQTVRAIEGMQRPDGGYAYWDGGTCSSPQGSAWAFLALSRAAAAGVDVDAGGLKRAATFLADTIVAGRPFDDCGWGDAIADDSTRVFALWALARGGAPRPSWYDPLVAKRAELPVEVRALLADALVAGHGRPEDAERLLKEVLDDAEQTPSGLSVPSGAWSPWSSDVRATAITLQALVDVSPDHPFVDKLTRFLLASRSASGRFRTTQDAAFALLALAEVTARAEPAVPDFVATVRLGERTFAEERFTGRSLDVRRAELPIADVLSTGEAPVPLAFSATGTGTLHYAALLRYAPITPPSEAIERGLTVQRWIEPWVGTGQVHTATAGELVRVRLRVATSRRRHLVALDVPIPAGLEVVDTSLATTARPPEPLVGDDRERDPLEAEVGAWWSPFDHVEHHEGRVVLFANELPPGVWETTLVARATTPGDFWLPVAHAEEMYAPEVFGRSSGGRFQVTMPAAPR